jgi:hypothetical protein
MAQKFLQQQQKDSAEYGTKVSIEGNVGVVKLAPMANTGSEKH